MQCARHPKVETGLACGRCETPICPKCVRMTDVGARCPDCAPARRLPQFEVGLVFLLRGAAAAIVAGGIAGAIWGWLLPGDWGLFAIFFGLALGYAVAEPVSLSTRRKSGTVLQIVAAGGVVIAYFVRNLIAVEALIASGDLGGFIALGVGIVVASGRLRF